ncbi:MAG: hypothetical protein NTX05_00475 [Fusobacteria bacterium]|nr:hypothetical protein [Fusobacteriota bacterium]
MKNVIYLSAYFSTKFKYFAMVLQSQGARFLGIGDKSYENLDPRLQGALTVYYRVNLYNYV